MNSIGPSGVVGGMLAPFVLPFVFLDALFVILAGYSVLLFYKIMGWTHD
jgi:hypothetical protein